MVLKLYNTFTKTKEEFVPLEAGKVKFYVCGPTVYDYIHIGNARAFIVFDVLRRFLKHLNYEVTYVMNLTDIDDRIIERSQKEGIPTEDITEKYTRAFFEDLDALGVQRADVHPKATEHVKQIIVLIQKLLDNGLAYRVNGDVYYDVSKFKNYGKLSGKKIADLVAGSRVAVGEKKRNPLDFALWKGQKTGEPAWESPWGLGRPGWHIECSAMSMTYLGDKLDIHAGGVDLVFPHHENEIAQSEGITKKKFVKYWLHNGFLEIEGEKMAKSLGNYRTVKQVLKDFPGVVLRLFFLQKHYRNPIDFTLEGLRAAESASARLKTFYENLNHALVDVKADQQKLAKQVVSKSGLATRDALENFIQIILESLLDDLNTPVAISHLFDFVRESNKLLSKEQISEDEKRILLWVREKVREMNSIFGIIEEKNLLIGAPLVNEVMKILISLRNDLRAKKQWDLADKIRNDLNRIGIVLEDKGGSSDWRLK
jgi:cysteinyl-tRNA synthetase